MRSIAFLCDESIDSYKNKKKSTVGQYMKSIVYEKHMKSIVYEYHMKIYDNICKYIKEKGI